MSYTLGQGTPFGGASLAGVSTVPEPAMIAPLTMIALMMNRRRRGIISS